MKMQSGSLIELSGKIYVRYLTTAVVKGEVKRVSRSAFLHDKDEQHFFRAYKVKGREHRKFQVSPALEQLRRAFMATVNASVVQQSGPLRNDRPIAEFYRDRFLPWAEQVLPVTGAPRLAPRTVRGHKEIWRSHLEKHFSGRSLRNYTSRDALQFLRASKDAHSKTVLRHIKTTASAIFSLAFEDEILAVNPWLGVKVPKDAAVRPKRGAYTLEESENMVSALYMHADCQLLVALCCFLGLRPSEADALQWGDFDNGFVHVRRAVVDGVVKATKNPQSVRSLPLPPAVSIALALWHEQSKKRKMTDEERAKQFIFQESFGDKLDHKNALNRVIKPHIKGGVECARCHKTPPASGVVWKEGGGLYSGRHGAATTVIELNGGNYSVGARLLGHKNEAVTVAVYKDRISDTAFNSGMERYIAAMRPKQLAQKSEK